MNSRHVLKFVVTSHSISSRSADNANSRWPGVERLLWTLIVFLHRCFGKRPSHLKVVKTWWPIHKKHSHCIYVVKTYDSSSQKAGSYESNYRAIVTWIGVRSMRVDGDRGSMTSLCLSVWIHLWASGSGFGVEATDNLLSLDPIMPSWRLLL